jgi:hypothetical protein
MGNCAMLKKLQQDTPPGSLRLPTATRKEHIFFESAGIDEATV